MSRTSEKTVQEIQREISERFIKCLLRLREHCKKVGAKCSTEKETANVMAFFDEQVAACKVYLKGAKAAPALNVFNGK